MTDKNKLTDERMGYDGTSVVIQVGGEGADNKQRCKYLMKKLLDNQEKAVKYDKSENYRYEWISKEELESYVKLRDKLESENKQLKEENNNLRSECKEAWYLAEKHKEKLEKMQKLMNNAGQLCVRCNGITGNELKEILGDEK